MPGISSSASSRSTDRFGRFEAPIYSIALEPRQQASRHRHTEGADIKYGMSRAMKCWPRSPFGENAFVLWPSPNAIIAGQMNEAAQWPAGSDGQWQRGRVWRPDPGQTFWVHASLSPDGHRLALPQSGDRIRVLETATGAELVTLEPPKAFGLAFVRFSPDGRFLAACGSREQVALWDLPSLRYELAALQLDWSDAGR